MADIKVEGYAYAHKVSNNEAKRRIGKKNTKRKASFRNTGKDVK